MVEIKHPDERVALAFELRREVLSRNVADHETSWHAVETMALFPNERDWLRANLERAEWPAWHPLHGGSMYRVTMGGEGDFTGQKKSALMRQIVKRGTGLKQNEIEWLMVRTGGREPNFRHTWWVFSHDELRSAERV